MFPRKVTIWLIGCTLAALLTSCAVRTNSSRSNSGPGSGSRTPMARARPTPPPQPVQPQQPEQPKGTATIQVSRDGSDILFTLTFRSPQGDFTPPTLNEEPTFEVVTADGKQVFSGKFEFG